MAPGWLPSLGRASPLEGSSYLGGALLLSPEQSQSLGQFPYLGQFSSLGQSTNLGWSPSPKGHYVFGYPHP